MFPIYFVSIRDEGCSPNLLSPSLVKSKHDAVHLKFTPCSLPTVSRNQKEKKKSKIDEWLPRMWGGAGENGE